MPGSPVLSEDEVAAIARSGMAQITLAAATDRLRLFYMRHDHWLKAEDHNHLRITRIIRSLRRLRSDQAADGFRATIFAKVEAKGSSISARSRGYWETA